MRFGQAFDVLDRAADDEPPAVAARQGRLVVALVDVLGEIGLLGPLQLGFGDTVRDNVGENRVDRGLDLARATPSAGDGVNGDLAEVACWSREYQPPAVEASLSWQQASGRAGSWLRSPVIFIRRSSASASPGSAVT